MKPSKVCPGRQQAPSNHAPLLGRLVVPGLSLWNNSILAAGAQYLVRGLTTNTTLRWLSLGANSVGPDGARAFAYELRQMSLQWLALGGNDIRDTGLMALGGAFKGDAFGFLLASTLFDIASAAPG